jgi:hypothetical protein
VVVNQTNQNILPFRQQPSVSSAKSSAEKEQKAENPALELAEFLPLAGYVFVVSAASALLISASVEVFGYSWQGWLKACLLEAGILLFAVSKAHGPTEWLIKRLSAAFLISLSLFILHSGVEINRQKQLVSVTTDDIGLKNIQERRARLLANHDKMPENYTIRREEVMVRVEAIDNEIEEKLEALKLLAPVQALNLSSMAETLMRVALLLISIIFSHAFVREVRLIFQGKEGLQGS